MELRANAAGKLRPRGGRADARLYASPFRPAPEGPTAACRHGRSGGRRDARGGPLAVPFGRARVPAPGRDRRRGGNFGAADVAARRRCSPGGRWSAARSCHRRRLGRAGGAAGAAETAPGCRPPGGCGGKRPGPRGVAPRLRAVAEGNLRELGAAPERRGLGRSAGPGGGHGCTLRPEVGEAGREKLKEVNRHLGGGWRYVTVGCEGRGVPKTKSRCPRTLFLIVLQPPLLLVIGGGAGGLWRIARSRRSGGKEKAFRCPLRSLT